MAYRPVKLSRKIARELIHRICPGVKIEREIPPSGIPNYRAVTPALEIRCETDYLDHDGKIHMNIFDTEMGRCWTMLFDPVTLKRDCDAEMNQDRR